MIFKGDYVEKTYIILRALLKSKHVFKSKCTVKGS